MIPIMSGGPGKGDNARMLDRRTLLIPTLLGLVPHLGCWLTLVLGGWTGGAGATPCHGPPANYLAVEMVALVMTGAILLDLWRRPARPPWHSLLLLLGLKVCAAWCQAPFMERIALSALDKAVQGTLLLLLVRWLVRETYPCCEPANLTAQPHTP